MTANSHLVALGSQPEIRPSDAFLLDPALFTNLQDFAFTARQKTLLADFIAGHSGLVAAYENGRLPGKESPEFVELRAFYEILKDAWFEAGDSDPPSAVQAPPADKLLSYLRMFVELPEAEMLKLRDNFAALFPSLATKIRERQEGSQPSSLANDEMCIFNNLRLCSMAKVSPEILCLLIPPLAEGENFFDPNTFLALSASKSSFPLLAEFLRKNAPQAMNIMFGCDLNDADAALVRAFLADFKRQSQPQLTAAELRLLKRRGKASTNAAQPQISAPVQSGATLEPLEVSVPREIVSHSIPGSFLAATANISVPEPSPSKPFPSPATSQAAIFTSIPSIFSSSLPCKPPGASQATLFTSIPSIFMPQPYVCTAEAVLGPATIPGPEASISKSIPNASLEPVPVAMITSAAPTETEVSSVAVKLLPETRLARRVGDNMISLTSKYIRDNDGKALSLSFLEMLKETFAEYIDYINGWLEEHPEILAAFEQSRQLSPKETALVDRFWRRLDMAKYRGEDADDLLPETVIPNMLPTYFEDLFEQIERLQSPRFLALCLPMQRTLVEFCKRCPDIYASIAANERLDRGQCVDVQMLDHLCFGGLPSMADAYATRSEDPLWKILSVVYEEDVDSATRAMLLEISQPAPPAGDGEIGSDDDNSSETPRKKLKPLPKESIKAEPQLSASKLRMIERGFVASASAFVVVQSTATAAEKDLVSAPQEMQDPQAPCSSKCSR